MTALLLGLLLGLVVFPVMLAKAIRTNSDPLAGIYGVTGSVALMLGLVLLMLAYWQKQMIQ